MKIKIIVAREWLILVVCLSIGFAGYVLDDYLSWKKEQVRVIDSIKEAQKLGYTGQDIYDYLAKKSRNMTRKTKGSLTLLDLEPKHSPGYYQSRHRYSFLSGFSTRLYLLFLPYLLSLFARSIIWSIRQLKR